MFEVKNFSHPLCLAPCQNTAFFYYSKTLFNTLWIQNHFICRSSQKAYHNKHTKISCEEIYDDRFLHSYFL
ncbi:hypothetical protein DOS83_00145 [Staphylococcus felis]|uniref:Uncharacterized protein n=1 Tax=Staphylococcus felis TaxID=46127 RepID=A0A3E0IT59_9STAP|nr:hypothetical protein DOS61_08345 [Staphylococcus felis]REH87965.1 hypothetical protein DOS58_09930 [Staphylococcus felis]REI01571.1 hypothetical protein DOS83_00145 [Staphylococcus felis]